jgi:prolyl 4-hydroxylase
MVQSPQSEADRLFEDAAERLRGERLPRDLPAARELFRRAGELGRRDAAIIHLNLVASGIGGERDWRAALQMLARMGAQDRRCASQLALINRMDIDWDGNPLAIPAEEVISKSPDIRLVRNLLTPEECAWLAAAARPMLQPSVVVDAATGRQTRDPVRTSDGIGFTWPLENPAVHALNRRFAAVSRSQVEQGEPLQVLRYRPGEQYRTHFDFIPGFANARVATLIVWLNDGFTAGETHFPAAGLSLRGKTGDSILFRNVDGEARRDPASAHAGLPVLRGEKIVASRWIRAAPFEPPVGGRAG